MTVPDSRVNVMEPSGEAVNSIPDSKEAEAVVPGPSPDDKLAERLREGGGGEDNEFFSCNICYEVGSRAGMACAKNFGSIAPMQYRCAPSAQSGAGSRVPGTQVLGSPPLPAAPAFGAAVPDGPLHSHRHP